MSNTNSATSNQLRQRVLRLVAEIPVGQVVTYGQLATLAGHVGAARQVGYIMNSLQDSELPWHRVINAQGRVSTHRLGFGDLQEALLQEEKIVFDDSGSCNLTKYQWWPSQPPTWADSS